MPEFISQDHLDADAVVPQFADNQLVTEDTFNQQVEKELDYTSPVIREQRKKHVRNEFNRALLYSSQVVLNRIAFKNNPFVFEYFKPDSRTLQDFAKLIRERAIVPWFFRERSLTDGTDFTTTDEGELACRALEEHLNSDYAYVRLAEDDSTNESLTGEMINRFNSYFRNLALLDVNDINEMASELFSNRPIDSQAFEEFDQQIQGLCEFALRNSGRGKFISREQIYKEFFIEPNHAPAVGRFRKPGVDGNPTCLFELKKLVDLRYDSNLPDLLNRYTFVSSGMPTRMALRDFKVFREQLTKNNIANFMQDLETRGELQQIVHSEMQKSFIVPIPDALQLSDVIEVRSWDEWSSFSDARRKLVGFAITEQTLEKGASLGDDFANFTEAFYRFQKKLGTWWIKKHPNAVAEKIAKEVYSKVSYGLKIGPVVIGLFSPKLGIAASRAKALIDTIVPSGIRSRVKGVSLNLLTDFFDARTMELNSDLSMCVELLNDNLEATREWTEETVQSAVKLGGLGSPASARNDQNRNEDA